MADVKISALPAAGTLDGTEVVPLVQGAATVKSAWPASHVGLTIIETATGVWSGDAPARTAGANPITFVSWTDPADATDGIATPANINEGDWWSQLSPPA